MKKETVLMITSGVVMTEIIWQMYKTYKLFRKKVANGNLNYLCKDKTKVLDVMFFSSDSALCRNHLEHKKACAKLDCAVRYLGRIFNYLNSAANTIDICMYFFTLSDLADVIINAQKRGVVVRMILDETMTQNDSSQVMYFCKEGIKPKLKHLDVLMHHKFAIIDNNILITGSVNWTKMAFFGNFENILITNEPEVVKPFINEFEKIWTML